MGRFKWAPTFVESVNFSYFFEKFKAVRKDREKCCFVALECIKRKIMECIEHNGALLQKDFHYKRQVRVSGKGSRKAMIFNYGVHQRENN